ncbi:PE-PPE domain-containing protein [Mycolicibacterium madagascariense]|uniref:PE-PPE domain-containing protein n=1 Tax=Mycolicibacterium madagascariense TaxID=212765 RepID=A0A7I7XBW6_9MYCO|nr:PE-PPE domain-containing protein [Mycolicibacterium madagascariense]MCV7011370.1 PE-PPE domain-containing protein [Mycolicibacterium madagascariense]BBZ26750.1 PE-PPE domain-containing protein [Mycolicibacterium madagascariense]
MRRMTRSVAVTFLAVLGTVILAIGSAFTAALAYGAVALIVPGTGTPNANIVAGYLTQARDRYLTTTACGADGSGCPDANLQGINYPASFFPLAFIPNWCVPGRCNTWDDSVGQGTTNLDAAINAALNDPNNPTQQVVVFGYSQGGAVVADALNSYINGLTDAQKARIQVVTIGGIENPDGGLWQRLAFLKYIPFLNISFNPPMNPDTGVKYTSYGFEYDPVVNAPRYFGNAFALINALAAFENVHGYYLAPNGNGPTETLPYGYTDQTLAIADSCTASPANCRTDQYGNTYVTIPALTLPIYNLLLSAAPAGLKPLLQPVVNLLSPVTRLLIDLGYDTTGDPSVPTPLSLLPFNPATFNPVKFAGQFLQAIAQGIYDAQHGISSLPVPSTSTPTVTSTLVSNAVKTDAKLAVAPVQTGEPATVTDITTKKAVASDSTDATTTPVSKTDAPTKDAAPTTATAADTAQTADVTKDDADTADQTADAAADTTKADTTKTDTTKTGTTKADTTKSDTTKVDTTTAGTTKTDTTKTGTAKTDTTTTPKKTTHDKADAGTSNSAKDTGDAGSDKKNAA